MVAGMLAESWEQPDPETIVFHLRQGVRWHDIPPVNGREFVADDVVYTLRRHYGAGAGEGSPAVQWVNINNISSVEAPRQVHGGGQERTKTPNCCTICS